MANKRINTGFSILGLSTSGISRILSHSLWLSYTGFSFSSICHHLLGPPVPPASLVYPTINQVPYFLFKNLIIFLIVSCFMNHKCIKHYIIWQIITITLKHEQHYMILVIQQMKASTYLKSTLWQVKRPISLEDRIC